ncbi:MAG: hypothetical protein LBR10_04715 [Prevotellaceae bacterium]|jgi:hypothetical protein|nr:hypothetical protein [Prevotellaceae bacterium]
MNRIIKVLRNIPCIFAKTCTLHDDSLLSDIYGTEYLGSIHDKQNMRQDFANLFVSIRKSTDEAKKKLSWHDTSKIQKG